LDRQVSRVKGAPARAPWIAFGLVSLALAAAGAALADEPPAARLAIANGVFSPKELHLPAGVQVRLLIRNDDALPAEFESRDLSRELVVPGNTQVTTYVGPLKPGRYRFFNDFNRAVQGEVVAEERIK